ncbi:MAG: hypothetical protein ACR2FS_06390, partial [Phormidesmis sp.]
TEYPEKEEQKCTELVAEQVQTNLEKLYGDRDYALRDTHTKTHACVKGTLDIFDFDQQAIRQTLNRLHLMTGALIIIR